MSGTDNKWEVANGVGKEHNENHVNRHTLLTPRYVTIWDYLA